MLTKKQVIDIQPKPFEPMLSYTRFKNGGIVPQNSAYYSPPRYKREWSFDGTHEITLKDGSKVIRDGSYIIKKSR